MKDYNNTSRISLLNSSDHLDIHVSGIDNGVCHRMDDKGVSRDTDDVNSDWHLESNAKIIRNTPMSCPKNKMR